MSDAWLITRDTRRRRSTQIKANSVAFNSSKALANAQKHIQKRNWDKAAVEYERIVQNDPSDMRNLLKLADLYVRCERQQDALNAYMQVAYHYLRDDIYDKAVAVFKQALQLDDTNPELHRDLGDAYHRLGRLKEAIRSFHRAREIFRERNDAAHQRDILERMVRVDPEDIGLRVQLAERYARDGMNDEAVGLLTFASDRLEEEGRLDEFLKVAERIIYLDESRADLRKKIARLYGERADYRRALLHLQHCFEIDPLDIETLRMLSFAFEQIDEPERAAVVYLQLGRVSQGQGNRGMSENAFRAVLRLKPDNTDAQQALRAMGAPGFGLHDSMPGTPNTGNLRGSALHQSTQPAPAHDVMADVEFLDDDLGLELGLSPAPATPQPVATPQQPPQHTSGPQRPVAPSAPRQRPIDVAINAQVSPPPADFNLSRALKLGKIFTTYGLWERAYECLCQVLMISPEHTQARELLAEMFDEAALFEQAARVLVELSYLVRATPVRSAEHLRAARALKPDAATIYLAAWRLGINLDAEVAVELDELVELDVLGDLEIAPFDDAFQSISSNASPEEEILEIDDLDIVEEDAPAASSFIVSSGQQVPVAQSYPGVGAQRSAMELDSDELLIEDPHVNPMRATHPPGGNFNLTDAEADQMFNELFGDSGAGSGLGGSLPGDSLGMVAEVDYLINQGMMSEAEVQLRNLEANHPGSATVQDRRLRIEQQQQGGGGFAYGGDGSFASRSLSGVFQHPAVEQPSGPLPTVGQAQQSIPNVLSAGGTMNTNFELGAAYMDMGLFEEALEEFRQALDDPEIADSATYSISICELKLGRADIARQRLASLIQHPQTSPDVRQAAQRALGQ